MSFLDNFAKNLSGGNQRSTTSYSSYGGNQRQSEKIYQCQYCGRQERRPNPQTLPTTSCPSRGTDYNGMRQRHVWREL